MKKVFLLLIVLVLTACDNPFKKYEESFDALTAALTMADKVDTINTIIDNITVNGTINLNSLTSTDVNNIISSLDYINTNLTNEQVQSIIESYDADLTAETLQTQLAEVENVLDDIGTATIQGVTNEQKQDIITLLTNITNQLTAIYS